MTATRKNLIVIGVAVVTLVGCKTEKGDLTKMNTSIGADLQWLHDLDASLQQIGGGESDTAMLTKALTLRPKCAEASDHLDKIADIDDEPTSWKGLTVEQYGVLLDLKEVAKEASKKTRDACYEGRNAVSCVAQCSSSLSKVATKMDPLSRRAKALGVNMSTIGGGG